MPFYILQSLYNKVIYIFVGYFFTEYFKNIPEG